MERIINMIKKEKMVIMIMLVTLIFSVIFQNFYVKNYSRVNNSTVDFVSAEVLDIEKNDIEYNENLQIYLGHQVLNIRILEGKNKGNEIVIDNYLTAAHNVNVSKGSKVIISADEPDGIAPYYSVYQFDRQIGISIFILVLFFFMICIGKEKGIKSIVGLGYTLYFIVYILLPTVFSGWSPIVMTIMTIICSTAVTLLLLNGESQKTYSAVFSTILGICLSGIIYYIMSYVLHINGFSSDEAESLVLINQATGLQIKDLLFVGILISSLGAIMDVAMSIVSSIYEIHYHKRELTVRELFQSGIEIGKDMIGTMSNTLILAFVGSAFVSILVLFSFQVDLKQLMNSNYIIVEMAQGLTGTLGVILTVPIASFISAYLLKKEKLQ